MARLIALLMPLPRYYNPDAKGVRRPIERWKFIRTAYVIGKHFNAGAEYQVFQREDQPHGFWWDRGLLSKDVLAYVSADLPDTQETRAWVRKYAERHLAKRFQQKAIYWKWLVVEAELARAWEHVSDEDSG